MINGKNHQRMRACFGERHLSLFQENSTSLPKAERMLLWSKCTSILSAFDFSCFAPKATHAPEATQYI